MSNKQNKTNYAFLAVSVPVYFVFAYFTVREDFVRMISLYAVLFAAFMFYYQKVKNESDLGFSLKIAFVLRLIFLFALPALSNDFYRFIWDGRMSVLGINPYLVLPKDFVGTVDMARVGSDAAELLKGQGSISPGNYTCYPPVNQFVFLLPAFLFPESILGSVVMMRIILVLSDLGTFFYARKILKRLDLPQSNILLYTLNPFIIIEMTGNLHFEGLTVFFLVFSLYLLLREKQKLSAVMLALSASVKLIPLLFLPFFMKKLGQWNSIKYYLIVGMVSILLFLPFLSMDLVENFMSSIDLYFRKFEFNASFYYLFREIGFHLKGWNIIQKLGPILGLASLIVILLLTFIPKNERPRQMMVSMLMAISVYYFFSTTVHPWYIALPLIISVFTHYRFVVLWSLLVMLSYYAYGNSGFKESMWLVGGEYLLLYGFLGYELIRFRKLGMQ
ncbi:MAG: DUF2029 domain-containing protein [Chlorobi bacterium]|nr:DUF2029 domain-containing protein [Chlorobiota bacterium]